MSDHRPTDRRLDLFKGIACLAVVLIHVRFPGSFGGAAAALARFAVPLFFAVAGRYLLPGDGYPCDSRILRRRCLGKARRTLTTALVATGIYTAYSFAYQLLSGMSLMAWLMDKYAPVEWRDFLLFNSGRVIYDGSYVYDHLWFVWALVYVYLICALCGERIVRSSGPGAAILLSLLYVGQALRLWYPLRLPILHISITEWYVLRNWLLTGLPFLLLGVWQRQAAYRRSFLNDTRIGRLLILCGIMLTLLEYRLLGETEVPLGALMIVMGCLITTGDGGERLYTATSLPARIMRGLSSLGRDCSAGVYYSHVMIRSLVVTFVYYLLPAVWASSIYDWLLPIVVQSLSVALAIICPIRRRASERSSLDAAKESRI